MATRLNTNRPMRGPASKYPEAPADQWATSTWAQIPKMENCIRSSTFSPSFHHCLLADSLSSATLPCLLLRLQPPRPQGCSSGREESLPLAWKLVLGLEIAIRPRNLMSSLYAYSYRELHFLGVGQPLMLLGWLPIIRLLCKVSFSLV